MICFLSMAACAVSATAGAVRWDYRARPVIVTENKPASNAVIGIAVGAAFDGYGAQGSRPAAVRAWIQQPPTEASPCECVIDYGQPVAPSAFVNYCYTPDNRDMRFMSPAPSAFGRVRISSRSDEKADWATVRLLENLPAECPQVLPVGDAKPARYWRLEVLEMVAGAQVLCTYELETYTGGMPVPPRDDAMAFDFRQAFARRIAKSAPAQGHVVKEQSLQSNAGGLRFAAGGTDCGLELVIGGEAQKLTPAGKGKWKSSGKSGDITVESKQTARGTLLGIVFAARASNPVQFSQATVRLSAPKPDLYYVPAYAWSRTPVECRVNSAYAQTRMACLGIGGSMLCLAPGTDRGALGFAGGSAFCDLLLGPEPTPVLVTAVKGDWWDAYRFAVFDIYGFREQPQTVPVSDIQYGISRYMLRDDVWEPTLGTVRSWPERDPHIKLVGFDCFQLYGAPYSIPTYWARWAMNGDKQALDRCRSIALWLCRSGVRVQDGPARGAFYTLQRFRKGTLPTVDARGSTQGWGIDTLTSQSTGSALWSLLYYRKATGDQDPEIGKCIQEAADWLMKTQTQDGGWPYGHDLQGKAVEAPPSSGTIWNIWALWRLGRETGDAKYSGAAKRATAWYAKAFMTEHHYHGYWEDVGPNCREGYEAGIAAVAFGEMGEKELAVRTARDAVQWVFTRQIENREPNNSAGLVAEQTGWPPASYCNPMMGLAAHTAWQITGDDFWKPFAMIPKAVGWWYQPDSGAMVWIVDSTQFAPIVGPAFESWWNDWCIAQVGSLTLRWLCREVNRFSGGAISLDEESLKGKALGRNVTAWAPAGGFKPIIPAHGQANWLGLRGSDSILLALANYGAAGQVSCHLDSRGADLAYVRPKAVHHVAGGGIKSAAWDGVSPVDIPKGGLVVLEWEARP